jgi:hypothetical protein
MTDRPSLLFGEDYFFALLLRMVLEHCSTMKAGELSSFAIQANADAMQALAEAGFIETFDQTDGRIRATVLPAADKLIAGLLADKHTSR